MTPGELLDLLAETPKALAHLVAEATEARLDEAAPGEWPARTVLAHLRDEESLVGRVRVERMLAEDEPEFGLFEPAPWEARRSRERDRKEQLLGDFALQRQATITLLRGLREADWKRTARHATHGVMTIEAWMTYWANHDAAHLRQVEGLMGESLAEVRARRARQE